jgi:hypothetical protein
MTVGQFSGFINAENLLNIRQTKEDPLVLPNRAADGQQTSGLVTTVLLSMQGSEFTLAAKENIMAIGRF